MVTLNPSHSHPTERLHALYQLAVELSALNSSEKVLSTALRQCLELTDSQFGFIGLVSEDQQALDVVAIEGFHPAAAFYEHYHLIPLRPNIFARVVLEDRPLRSEDAMVDPSRIGQPESHPPTHAFLGVPLRLRDNCFGMIGVANRPSPYEDEHEQLLMTYAAQVAIVINNTQLYEQLAATNEVLEQKVQLRTAELEEAKEALAFKAEQLHKLLSETVDIQERERQRISQDMHDGINQLLIGGLLELKTARKRIDRGDVAHAEESLDAVNGILHRVETELKQIVYDLRPPSLDALGLVPALRRQIEKFEQYNGIACSLTVFGDPIRLAQRPSINVYRVVQEALHNTGAHAGAARVDVIVVFAPRTLKLTVIDDGRGFDLAAVRQQRDGHFGLLGMEERAESLGGTLTLESTPDQGTKIEFSIPLQGKPEPSGIETGENIDHA